MVLKNTINTDIQKGNTTSYIYDFTQYENKQ